MSDNIPVISKNTFIASKWYDGLTFQKGTWLFDFDWNEAQDIVRDKIKQLASRAFGNGRISNALTNIGGFAVTLSGVTTTENFKILAGSAIVDGRLIYWDSNVEYNSASNVLFNGTITAISGSLITDTSKNFKTLHDLVNCIVTIQTGGGAVVKHIHAFSATTFTLDAAPAGAAIGDTYAITVPILTTTGGVARSDEAYIQMWEDDISEVEDPSRTDNTTGLTACHATRLAFCVRVAEGAVTPTSSPSSKVWFQKIADIDRTALNPTVILSAMITNVEPIQNLAIVSEELIDARTSANWPVYDSITPDVTTYASLDLRLESHEEEMIKKFTEIKGYDSAVPADLNHWDDIIDQWATFLALARRYWFDAGGIKTVRMGIGLRYYQPTALALGWYRESANATGGGIVIESDATTTRIRFPATYDGNHMVLTWANLTYTAATSAIELPGPLAIGNATTAGGLTVYDGAVRNILTQLQDITGGANWYDIHSGANDYYDLHTVHDALDVLSTIWTGALAGAGLEWLASKFVVDLDSINQTIKLVGNELTVNIGKVRDLMIDGSTIVAVSGTDKMQVDVAELQATYDAFYYGPAPAINPIPHGAIGPAAIERDNAVEAINKVRNPSGFQGANAAGTQLYPYWYGDLAGADPNFLAFKETGNDLGAVFLYVNVALASMAIIEDFSEPIPALPGVAYTVGCLLNFGPTHAVGVDFMLSVYYYTDAAGITAVAGTPSHSIFQAGSVSSGWLYQTFSNTPPATTVSVRVSRKTFNLTGGALAAYVSTTAFQFVEGATAPPFKDDAKDYGCFASLSLAGGAGQAVGTTSAALAYGVIDIVTDFGACMTAAIIGGVNTVIFTAPRSGVYSISGSAYVESAGTSFVTLSARHSVPGVGFSHIGLGSWVVDSPVFVTASGSTTRWLKAGDSVSICITNASADAITVGGLVKDGIRFEVFQLM